MKKDRLVAPQGEKRRLYRSVANLIFITLAAAGCTGVPRMLQPSSVNATRISDLTWSIMAIAAFVFIVVEVLLIFTAVRYRRQPGAGIPRQIAENIPLEIGWTSFPAIVLAVVFALTLGTLLAINPSAQSASSSQTGQVLNIRVIGHQWWWEFQYPDQGVTTANEMHIPVGTTVNLQLESADVIHSFWVPEMGNKKDAIPGLTGTLTYTATKPGRYSGQCAEFCGVQHALMQMQVVAETPDQFQAWVADQKAPAAAATGVAAQGEQVFLASPCVGCHTIQGTKALGKIGPDLTHFASRARFAGAAFDNNTANLTSWLLDPQQLKPGNHMPNLGMTPTTVAQLVQFLQSLK
jgi:cytochrome c oxidase subunit II